MPPLWQRASGVLGRLLPEGRALPYDVWQARHRGIVVLLWLQTVAILIYGYFIARFGGHVFLEVGGVALTAAAASWPRVGRAWRTVAASFGLVTCSAILVHYSGGLIEMHFHFFVMVAVVTLYQSWTPYLVAILYVALHHGIVGVLDPLSVYNHRDAWLHPWKWAGIHAAFVLAASAAGLVTWRLNEALRARTDSILESAGEGICGLDRQGRVMFINDTGARLLGYHPDELVGRDWSSLAVQAEDALITKTGALVPVECTRVAQTKGSDAGGAVLTFKDISERLQAEAAIRELNEELELRVQELARSNGELELFAYAASHDLQEPLRMVSGFVQLLGKRYKGQLDADADEFIGFAVDGVTRMQRLINDLLAYSRVGSRGGELLPTSAGEAAHQALTQLQAAVDETGARVSIGDLPEVNADATQLTQLFQNLIGNAIKFHGDAPPEVKVEARAQGSEWLFSVADNGIGVDPQYAERIFVLFQRLHSIDKYQGTGIGLALCKRIVERHGGRIWLESEPGEGSTFWFTLPALQEAAA